MSVVNLLLNRSSVRLTLSFIIIVGILLSLVAMINIIHFNSQAESGVPKGVDWQIEPMWGAYPTTNWTAVEQDATDMQNAGINWGRVDWPESHSFAYFDQVVAISTKHNINILPIIESNSPSGALGNQSQRDTYKTWLAQVVARYKTNIHYWEIENEENKWPVADFVQHMKDSFETIHAVDPTAKVVFGGLSQYQSEGFIDQMIQDNAYRYMDIMAFHPYGSSPKADLMWLQLLKSKMATQPGFATKPIWITEVGFFTGVNWPSNAGEEPTEQAKADALIQVMQLLRNNGAQLPIFWYVLHESANISGYGLTQRNPVTLQTTYLPAYTAYKNLWANETYEVDYVRV